MKARVKEEYRWKTITAFGGVEFTKGEFRNVPTGFEDEAKSHPALEIEHSVDVPVVTKKSSIPSAESLLKKIVESEPIEVEPEEKKSRKSKKEQA